DEQHVDGRLRVVPRPQPGCAADDVPRPGAEAGDRRLGRPDPLDPPVGDVVGVVRPLGDAKRDTLGGRRPRDLLEEVADDPVGLRGDSDAPPGLDEVEDHPRPGAERIGSVPYGFAGISAAGCRWAGLRFRSIVPASGSIAMTWTLVWSHSAEPGFAASAMTDLPSPIRVSCDGSNR